MRTIVFAALLLGAAVGCAGRTKLPTTPGERATAFGYIPVDGLPVRDVPDPATCTDGRSRPLPLVDVLPDVSVRFAVASVSVEGAVSFGPAQITASGSTYRAILDDINVDAVPVDFLVRRTLSSQRTARAMGDTGRDSTVGFEVIPRAAAGAVERVRRDSFDIVTIPIYVGIGMRLTADIRALKAGVSLTSLGGIGFSAQGNRLAGTLTVQTLGISGRAIAASLPMPSGLSQSSVENAILALGASRSLVYTSDSSRTDIITTPRIVGLYSPLGNDPRLINALYTELARNPPEWHHRCAIPQQRGGASATDR